MFVCFVSFCPSGAFSGSAKSLILLNWANYISPQVLESFEKEYGIPVSVVAYESGDERDVRIMEVQGRGFDLVVGSSGSFKVFQQLEFLEELDETQVPNLKHIHPKWIDPKQPGRVPYLWGTTGVIYRKDLIQIESWKDLYLPRDELKGRLLILPEVRLTVGFGLLALGYAFNSTNVEQLGEVKQLLADLRPHVRHVGDIFNSPTDGIVTGETWVGIGYNGQVPILQKFNPNIAYKLPKEGAQAWIDFIGVLRRSEQKEKAIAFINFINEPENAATNTQFTGFASANQAAAAFLPPEILNDSSIYISEKDWNKLNILDESHDAVTRSHYFAAFSQLTKK